jgi:hypothetical protein
MKKYISALFIVTIFFMLYPQEGQSWWRRGAQWAKKKMDERVDRNLPPLELVRYINVEDAARSLPLKNQLDTVLAKLETFIRAEKVKDIQVFAGSKEIYTSLYLRQMIRTIVMPKGISYSIESQALGANPLTIKITYIVVGSQRSNL